MSLKQSVPGTAICCLSFSNWPHELSTTEPNCAWSQPGKWIVVAKSIVNVFLTRSSLKEFFHTVRTFCHAWKQMMIVIFVKLLCFFVFLFCLAVVWPYCVCFCLFSFCCMVLRFLFVSLLFFAFAFSLMLLDASFHVFFCFKFCCIFVWFVLLDCFSCCPWWSLFRQYFNGRFWAQVCVRELKQTKMYFQMRNNNFCKLRFSPAQLSSLESCSHNSWREFGTRVAFECGNVAKEVGSIWGALFWFWCLCWRLWDGNGVHQLSNIQISEMVNWNKNGKSEIIIQ